MSMRSKGLARAQPRACHGREAEEGEISNQRGAKPRAEIVGSSGVLYQLFRLGVRREYTDGGVPPAMVGDTGLEPVTFGM